ncbi:MAG: SDR family oxidoreductase, partial [Candidatus Omnitrophica bacterium]|nr:SDR family oxidoreductase [Candidatus Omnitrophota bacterium]
ENVKSQMLSYIPLNRFGKASDVAQLAMFLASDASSYITGQVIKIDGGMVM